VDGLDVTAREARDVARDTLAQTRAQDIPAKIAELKGHVDQLDQGQRADLVNSTNKITAELRQKYDTHEQRLSALEDFRNRIDGSVGVFGWIGKHAPWLGMALMTGLAALGFRDKIP
jgi:BMFP domain-containing protein YqiC